MMLFALLLAGPVVDYDNGTLPQLWQQGGRWRPVDGLDPYASHPAPIGGLGRLSNPNHHHFPSIRTEFPRFAKYVPRATGQWMVADGCKDVQGLAILRELHIPDGKFVETWTQRENYPSDGVSVVVRRWTFPPGTKVVEHLYHDNSRHWLTRTREKLTAGKWDDGNVEQVADDPPGYRPSGKACIECHRDAGRHVSRLPGHRGLGRRTGNVIDSWYGFLRGSDTVFSWRPVNSRGQILPQFRHIVRTRR